jgi:phospholipid transport system substrate-binding protein
MGLTRRLAFLALAVLLAGLPPLRPAAAAEDPTAFMTTLGNRLLALINDKKQAESERKEQFQKLAEEAFDIPKIAQWVLGRYWRSASDAEKQSFGKAFETYMVQVYWSRLTSYNGETFSVAGAHDEGNGTILVTTEILRPDSGQPPVKISWSLVKQADSYKIRDASLEGISQAQTYRDEFASIIERNGGQISALINQLNERAKG